MKPTMKQIRKLAKERGLVIELGPKWLSGGINHRTWDLWDFGPGMIWLSAAGPHAKEILHAGLLAIPVKEGK